MRDALLTQATRIVVKIGSSLVASRDTGLLVERIDRLAKEIATLGQAARVVLVPPAQVSPASKIRSDGNPKSPLKKPPQRSPKQAHVGYEKSFELLDVKVAQSSSRSRLADRRRFLNARHR